MKILIISNLYTPYARGGAETVVKTVVDGLAERGHVVRVLTARPFFPLNLYFVRNDYRHSTAVRFLWRIIDTFNPHSAIVLARLLAREKPDVVMTHNLVGFGLLTPWVIRRAGVRHLHTLHDVQLIHPSGLLLWGQEQAAERAPARRAYEMVTRKLFGSPDVVISPSRWLLEYHVGRGFFPKSKTVVLPNPVMSTDQITNQPTNQLTLLYAGQLEPHKGIRWLIEQRKENREQSWVLEIAGAGSLEAEVKKAAAAHPAQIVFLGQLDSAALTKKMDAARALVVPSLCYENAPRIISEALSRGLPVVASRLGGIPEMIRDGENGFLFEPGNVEEFFRTIEKIKTLHYPLSVTRYPLPDYLDSLERLC